jgi:ABC-2 type transport system ATP-binding protein
LLLIRHITTTECDGKVYYSGSAGSEAYDRYCAEVPCYRTAGYGGDSMKFIIEHLSKHFEKKEVLRDITFTFEEGRIYGLLGRNGAGKTTLFNCLNRDIRADGGAFFLETETGRRETVPQDIGYVLSTPTVPEFLTGREFLKFFLDINEKTVGAARPLDEYFDYMSIAPEDRDKLLKDYSHGMKNKMQMLVNIIARPNLLLLDEPLTSLDVVVAEEMKQLLRSLKSGRIILFSTHIMDLALDLCDEIVLLNHGELEVVEKQHLDVGEFREKIIAALREEEHD